MTNGKLLKKSEKNTCERISASGTGLEAKRATALLALDEGTTQTAAATKAGLTLGQVRYLLTIFRDRSTAIFAVAKPNPVAKTAKAKKEKAGKGDKKKVKKDKDKKKKKEKNRKKKGKKSKKK